MYQYTTSSGMYDALIVSAIVICIVLTIYVLYKVGVIAFVADILSDAGEVVVDLISRALD